MATTLSERSETHWVDEVDDDETPAWRMALLCLLSLLLWFGGYFLGRHVTDRPDHPTQINPCAVVHTLPLSHPTYTMETCR